jgi:nucleotide-binding universal stress UspA family protein
MKILLATDGSAFSEEAAKFLTNFPFTPKDTIHLFHVVSTIPYEDDFRQQVLQAIRKFSPKILKTCEECIKPSAAVIMKEEGQGVPEDEIVKKAGELDVDLVVMGARGVKGVKSLFLGSVTRAVAALTDRPILVTKPSSERAGRALKVLFATDGSESSVATADVLAGLPFPEGSELTILNIARSAVADIPDRYVMEVNDAMKAELARIRTAETEKAEKIVDRAKTRLAGRFAFVHGLIKGGDPTDEVLKTAGEMKADLIAIGSRGLKGIKGRLGSVSRRVLGRAPCCVLIGKERNARA